MITEEMLYWIFRLDAIKVFCIFIEFLVGAISLMLTCSLINVHDMVTPGDPFYKKLWITAFGMYAALIVSTLTLIFLPSTKEMAAIKIIPVICNSEFVQKELPKESKELYDIAKYAVKKSLIN